MEKIYSSLKPSYVERLKVEPYILRGAPKGFTG